MCFRSWKTILPFLLTFVFGVLSANLLQKLISLNTSQEEIKASNKLIYEDGYSGNSRDYGKCNRRSGSLLNETLETAATPPVFTKTGFRVISKPKALYTDEARQNGIQGTLSLRVTFLASGKIGNIAVISGLDGGLTEQAITAARAIRFEPLKVNNVAHSVTKQVNYTFTLF